MTAIDQMVNDYVTALSDDGENSVPMATTDSDEVIRSQLTENTGRHLLDSGGAYGRNLEENQDNPPWEQPAWDVKDSYVVHNVYDFMRRNYRRDETAVAAEIGLYAYAYHGPGKGDSWLACMGGYADFLSEPSIAFDELQSIGLPRELAEQAAYSGVEADSDRPQFSFNTYNGECHTLTQCLQGCTFGGPYAKYSMIQVHGGCDVRGGYTAPRVYSADGWVPHELEFRCQDCEWIDHESCLYGDESLIYLPSPDEVGLEHELDERGYDYEPEAVEDAIFRASDPPHYDGAVFHICGDGRIGVVEFS